MSAPATAAKPRLFVFDGSALVYRSHFAYIKNPLRNARGVNTSAAYGFTRDLLRILDDEEPERVAVVFDVLNGKSFRHDKYAEYKSTRQQVPAELEETLPYVEEIVDALGVPRFVVPGYEGDDLVATLAKRGVEAGFMVFVVTGDKDFCQLVSEDIRIYNPWRNPGGRSPRPQSVTVMGPKDVEARYKVTPGQFRDFLALMGDSSDNVPGVPKVGEKRAAELINRFGDLEQILANAAEVKQPSIRKSLEENAELARLSLELVTLDDEAPIEADVDGLVARDPDRQELSRLFTDLEFRDLLKRFSVDFDDDPHVHHRVTGETLPELIQTLEACDEFVFDLETTSLDPQRAEIVGMAFSVQGGEAYYLGAEEKMSAGTNFQLFGFELDFKQHLERLRPVLENPAIEKGGQNVKYDVLVLARHGIEVQGIAFDTLIESYLLDPGARTHGLDDLALRYLNYKKIATSDVLGPGKKRNMRDTPDHEIFPYASEDADITYRLHALFTRLLAREEGLTELYRDVELPLLHVLVAMEQRGVKIDTAVLEEIGREFKSRLRAMETEVFELAGEVFNLSSPKQVGTLFFDTLELHKQAGIRPKRTATGAYSTDHETLEQLAEHHPLPRKILEHRSLEKLLGTYVEALPQLISPLTGRVHTSFNQAVTATGRLSSSDPNLQNIPIRTAEGRRIRSAFVAGHEGWLLLSADYSQVELRVLAHLSGDPALIEAFQADQDIHRATAARIFEVPFGDVPSDMRGRAKAINFGIVYGMGATRLARDTGLDYSEAKEFIDGYFAKHPQIKAFLDGQVEHARQRGFVETLLKRRRPLPDIRATSRLARSNAERMAVNTPIQGSAADLIKLAMIKVERRLQAEGLKAQLLLQVHDELVLELPQDERQQVERLVREEMEQAYPLAVPLKVDLGVGQTWLEAH